MSQTSNENTNYAGEGGQVGNCSHQSGFHPNGRPIGRRLVRPRRIDGPVMEQVFPETTIGKLLNGLVTCALIKQEPRMGWARKAACDEPILVPYPNETVASHQWGAAWIVFALCKTEEFQMQLPAFDRAVAYEMALAHDLGELVIGDYTPVDNITPDQKHKLESEAMDMISGKFPVQTSQALQEVYQRYERRQCSESRVVKDCDRLDFMITAFVLERQGFTGFSEFYSNTNREKFSIQITRDLANVLTETRDSLLKKGSLYRSQ